MQVLLLVKLVRMVKLVLQTRMLQGLTQVSVVFLDRLRLVQTVLTVRQVCLALTALLVRLVLVCLDVMVRVLRHRQADRQVHLVLIVRVLMFVVLMAQQELLAVAQMVLLVQQDVAVAHLHLVMLDCAA